MATAFRLVSGGYTLVLSNGTPTADDPIWITSYNLGYPAPRVVDGSYAGQSGKYDLTWLHDARTVTFEIKIRGDGTLTSREQIQAQLAAMCHPSNRLLLYILRSDFFGVERVMELRADPYSLAVGHAASTFYEMTLQFQCPLGLMEDTVDTATSMGAADLATGLALPAAAYADGIATAVGTGTGLSILAADYSPDGISSATTGWTLDAASSSSTSTLTNTGNVPAPPVFRIYGAVTNPKIRNDTTNEVLDFSANGGLTVPSGQFLEINVQDKTVFMNADPNYSYYSKINWVTSSWFDLGVGDNIIAFQGSGIDASALLTVTFTRRWI